MHLSAAEQYNRMNEAMEVLSNELDGRVPRVVLITGSGLGEIANAVKNPHVISYTEIPFFPRPSVAGHPGKLVVGEINGVMTAVLQGRVHFYEGEGVAPLAVAIRALKKLGAELLFLTGATGTLKSDAPPGSIMLVKDHVNFLGRNPLEGPNDDRIGPRFPAMANAWDKTARDFLHLAAKQENIKVTEGVYGATLGPNIETAAEVQMLKKMGVDMVGMSMVTECLIARHCGLKVAGLGVQVNWAEGLSDEPISHELVVSMAAKQAPVVARLVSQFLGLWSAA